MAGEKQVNSKVAIILEENDFINTSNDENEIELQEVHAVPVMSIIRQSRAEKFWGKLVFYVSKFDLSFMAGMFTMLVNFGNVTKALLLRFADIIFPFAAFLKGLDFSFYLARFLNARNKNFGKTFNLIFKGLELAA